LAIATAKLEVIDRGAVPSKSPPLDPSRWPEMSLAGTGCTQAARIFFRKRSLANPISRSALAPRSRSTGRDHRFGG
jgi:hypothetical protein